MSLKIVYGTSGTGKTTECIKIIKQYLSNSTSNLLYIVPEQYSLETERNISSEFNQTAMDRIEVLSFERLAGKVFSSVGPVICDYLDNNAKIMLIEKILLKLSDKLTYFTKSSDASDFASVIYDVIKSFKTNCVTSDILKEVMKKTTNASLKFKLYDLLLIYEEYNKFFNVPYTDSDDVLTMVVEKIEKFNLFSNTHIIFDNFTSFSKQQLRVIEALMVHSPNVIVTLVADDLDYKNNFQLFYKSKQTANILFQMALDNNVQILPNTYLSKCYDNNVEFKFLKENYFNNKSVTFYDITKSTFICKSPNYNAEIEQIASEISRIVREEGYRYKDFAVITRSGDIYFPIIKDVFERYGIFYNITEPTLSSQSYLYPGMMSVFEIVQSNYSFESVFDFIHSPLCCLDDYDKYLLENYVLEVGNTAGLWTNKSEIKFKGSFSDKSFERVKNSFKYVRNCLNAFSSQFHGRKNVTDIVNAYSDFLHYIKAEKTIKSLVQKWKDIGDNQAANELIAVYNQIMNSLNQMLLYFGNDNITFEKFYKILKSGLIDTELDQIPSGVDDVYITTIDRFQSSKAKVVFVVGMHDGVLPCGYINEGLLKDNELNEIGIEGNVAQKHCDENYVIYRMFSSASEKIYFSYSVGDNEGNGLSPSPIISRLKLMFPNIKEIQNLYLKLNKLDEIEGVIPTFNKVIVNGEENFWKEVAKWYHKNRPDLYDIINNSHEYHNKADRLFSDTVRKLYGENINSSISRIEKYNQCAFAYFIRYGLNVDERKEFKIEARDYGTYTHEIIEKYSLFATECGWDNITEEMCHKKSEEITMQVLKENLSDYYTKSDRHSYLFNKIVKTMKTVLWSITDFYKHSGYVSIGHEITFDENGEFPPITVVLSNGMEVTLRGKIDRADICRTENGNFVSIVDYKSGAKDIEFEKILCGIQIQLPVYIKAVCKGFNKNGENTVPAAMLYYHIDEPLINGNKGMSDEEIVKEIHKELKMKGIFLENSQIPSGYVVKKNATSNQLDKLCKTAYNQVKSALEKMVNGNIDINPVCVDNSTACDYCPYGNICNFESGFKDNEYNHYKKIKMEEFFAYVDEMDC